MKLMDDDVRAGAERPGDLFDNCKSKEQALGAITTKNLVQQTLRDYLFEYHPLFVQAFRGRYEPLLKRIEGRYPFDFSIVRREEANVSEGEWRYAQILEHVKKLGEGELRLLLIARWLKQEGVCEPEEFLPKIVLRRLLRKYKKKEQMPLPKDLFYFRLVRIWLPFFERLLADLRSVPKTNRGEEDALVKGGYDEQTVKAAFGKKSPVQAAVTWLEVHKGINARTLEKAYSRVLSRLQKDRPGFV